MSSDKNTGFTIIETMLFLAVSAALFAGVMLSVNAGIERQRYRDSVTSLKSFVQEQYSKTVNVNNEARTTPMQCEISGSSLTISEGAAGESRGQSDCVILGRYITSEDGITLTAGSVVAKEIVSPADDLSDFRDITDNYRKRLSTLNQETYQVSWGNKIVIQSSATTPKPFTMMFVRSPQSGSILALSSPVSSFISPAWSMPTNLSTINLCVSDGDSGIKHTGVQVPAYTSSQSTIKAMTDTESVCS